MGFVGSPTWEISQRRIRFRPPPVVACAIMRVALGCAIYVLIAALIAHRNFGDGNQLSHFMKNMAIVGGFLAIMALGPGAYSVDGRKT